MLCLSQYTDCHKAPSSIWIEIRDVALNLNSSSFSESVGWFLSFFSQSRTIKNRVFLYKLLDWISCKLFSYVSFFFFFFYEVIFFLKSDTSWSFNFKAILIILTKEDLKQSGSLYCSVSIVLLLIPLRSECSFKR